MAAPRILVFAGSVRTASFNQRLADLVAHRLEDRGAAITRISLKDYPLPLYDNDLEVAEGVPGPACQLHELFRTHQGIFIASPEYNANPSPLLLNVVAWVSRITDQGGMAAAFGTPIYALGSASPGPFGGYRGLMSLRHSLELQLLARVLPPMVAVGSAQDGFDSSGGLTNPRMNGMLSALVQQLATETAKL